MKRFLAWLRKPRPCIECRDTGIRIEVGEYFGPSGLMAFEYEVPCDCPAGKVPS